MPENLFNKLFGASQIISPSNAVTSRPNAAVSGRHCLHFKFVSLKAKKKNLVNIFVKMRTRRIKIAAAFIAIAI